MARLVIFGAGDIARLAHYYFTRDSGHEVVAFAVDREYRTVDSLAGLPVLDVDEACRRFPPGECQAFVALSYARMNRIRCCYGWSATFVAAGSGPRQRPLGRTKPRL